jgi:hypothetical protein
MFTEAKRPKIVADAGGSITPKLETALVAKKEKPRRRLDLTVPSHGLSFCGSSEKSTMATGLMAGASAGLAGGTSAVSSFYGDGRAKAATTPRESTPFKSG